MLCKSNFGEASIYEASKANQEGKKLLEMSDYWLVEFANTFLCGLSDDVTQLRPQGLTRLDRTARKTKNLDEIQENFRF